jgi:hypothetical protein
MIKKLLSVKPEKFPSAFATLTFPDDTFQHVKELGYRDDIEGLAKYAQRCWNLYITKLRKDYGDIAYIQRVEFEPRKSGDFKGQPIPHFHVLWSLPSQYCKDKKKLSKLILQFQVEWWKIAGLGNSKALEVTVNSKSYELLLESNKKVVYYLSKYCSKSDSEIYNVIDSDTGEVRPACLGRHWKASRNWPSESPQRIELNLQDVINLRRLLRKKLKSIGRKGSSLYRRLQGLDFKGFTLFLPYFDIQRYIQALKPL